MKAYWLLVPLLLLAGCTSKVDPEGLAYLNGYWEIEKVVFPDGSSKSYEVNASIDYMEIGENEGFRKKMQPQFDGTFKTSDDAEQFTINTEGKTLIMQYSNAENRWEEVLVSLSENHFAVKNETGITYHYKRYEPLELN